MLSLCIPLPFGLGLLHSERSALHFLCNPIPEAERLAFAIDPPDLSAADELKFMEKNPDHLRLDLAKLTPRGLKQAWLSARTNDARSLRIWRKIAQKVKRMTNAGVWAINPKSGASSFMKSYRFTRRAKELEESGVSILPPAGTSVLKLCGNAPPI